MLNRSINLFTVVLLTIVIVKGEVIGPFTSSSAIIVAPECRTPKFVQRNPAVAYGDGVYLVVWSDGGMQPIKESADIYCARICASTGISLDPGGVLICGADYIQNNPRVAFDGTNFFVIWEDFRNNNDYDIYFARVRSDGVVMDPGGVLVSGKAGINEARPDIAFTGSQFIAVWMDARRPVLYGIFGSRISTTGQILDPEGIEIVAERQSLIDSVTPPNFQWTGTSKYNAYEQWWENISSKSNPSLACNDSVCALAFLTTVRARPNNDLGMLFVDKNTGRPKGKANNLSAASFQDRPSLITDNKGFLVFAGTQSSSRGGGPSMVSLSYYDLSNYRTMSYVSPQVMAAQRESRKAVIFNGTHYITAMDYWVNAIDELVSSAIALNRYNPGDTTLMSPIAGQTTPGTLIETMTASQGSVRHCAMTSGESGAFILLYEKNEGANSCRIIARIMSEN